MSSKKLESLDEQALNLGERTSYGMHKLYKQYLQQQEYWNKHKKKHIKYSEELAEELCSIIASTPLPYNKIHELYPHLPDQDTVVNWRRKREGFAERWLEAKKVQVELLVDDMIFISDDDENDILHDDAGKIIFNQSAIFRAKLKIETRKWLAARLLPMYAERQIVDNNISVKSHEDLLRELDEA